MKTAKVDAPKNIPYFYNRASNHTMVRLRKTFDHFNIQKDQPLVGEVILRLEKYLHDGSFIILPTDDSGKALFCMYRYYDKQ